MNEILLGICLLGLLISLFLVIKICDAVRIIAKILINIVNRLEKLEETENEQSKRS